MHYISLATTLKEMFIQSILTSLILQISLPCIVFLSVQDSALQIDKLLVLHDVSNNFCLRQSALPTI